MRQFYCSRLFGFKIKPFLFKEKQKAVPSSGVRSTFTPRLLFFYTTGFAVMRSVSSKCISAVQEATLNQAWLTALGSDCRADDVLFVPLRTGKSCFFLPHLCCFSHLFVFNKKKKSGFLGSFVFFLRWWWRTELKLHRLWPEGSQWLGISNIWWLTRVGVYSKKRGKNACSYKSHNATSTELFFPSS